VDLDDTGVDSATLHGLAIKLAYTVPHLSTEWATRQLRLPLPVVQLLLEQLRSDGLVETLGQVGPFNFRYAITQRGRERAGRLFEVSGYLGPAPVSLEAYTTMLEWQMAHSPCVSALDVQSALSDLLLTPEALHLAGLAVSSGRSLFVFGPPGNGKTSLGRMLHAALKGDLWVPHCISVENDIIRFFDPQCHEVIDPDTEHRATIDQRWLRIRRPLVVVGGEVTLDSFDLIYSSALRYYEAPLHFKANGGTFLVDDFGREGIDPHQLLNRWITPLEHQIDYLTIRAGQKIKVPLRLRLIFATNLSPETVTDPAFLRRMGYRLYLGPPSPERYAQILERYLERLGVSAPPGIIPWLLERYQAERRELRCCEPRDLLERAVDFCRFREQPLTVNEQILGGAWTGYFGNKQF
jgi:predicted ATPase with chaperone activity